MVKLGRSTNKPVFPRVQNPPTGRACYEDIQHEEQFQILEKKSQHLARTAVLLASDVECLFLLLLFRVCNAERGTRVCAVTSSTALLLPGPAHRSSAGG